MCGGGQSLSGNGHVRRRQPAFSNGDLNERGADEGAGRPAKRRRHGPRRRLAQASRPKVKIGLGAALPRSSPPRSSISSRPAPTARPSPADRLTISTVSQGRFDDFLPLRARVEPSLTVYLDAVEGGRVERILVEDGARVQRGQIARGDDQCRPPAERARPPDRGHPADQFDAQPGARAQPDRGSPTSARGSRPISPPRPRAAITRCSGRSPTAASSRAAASPTAATPMRPIAAAPTCFAASRPTTNGCSPASSPSCATRPARSTPASASPAAASIRSTCARRSTASSPPSRSRSASR